MNTTRIMVSYRTTNIYEDILSSSSLSLNYITRVRLEAVGRYRMLYVNDSLAAIRASNISHIFGNATVFLSSPWSPPASASISLIQMSSLIPPSPRSVVGIPVSLRIYNSLLDDCSKESVSDAGCGRNLQCNAFSDGRATCGPVKNSMVKLLHSIDDSETDSIIVSKRHQTCGSSSRYRNKCAQTDGYSLTCTPVTAIVNGQISEKSICLADFEMQQLQKRVVRRIWCYSDCYKNVGTNFKFI